GPARGTTSRARTLSARLKEFSHGTNSSAADHRGAVAGERGIRRLGIARLPHRTRRTGCLPRAVLPGWPRARRSAAGVVAGLLPVPGPGRLLDWRAVACAGAGPRRHRRAGRGLFCSSMGWARKAAVTRDRLDPDRCAWARGGAGHLGSWADQDGLISSRTGSRRPKARGPSRAGVARAPPTAWRAEPPGLRLATVSRRQALGTIRVESAC